MWEKQIRRRKIRRDRTVWAQAMLRAQKEADAQEKLAARDATVHYRGAGRGEEPAAGANAAAAGGAAGSGRTGGGPAGSGRGGATVTPVNGGTVAGS